MIKLDPGSLGIVFLQRECPVLYKTRFLEICKYFYPKQMLDRHVHLVAGLRAGSSVSILSTVMMTR